MFSRTILKRCVQSQSLLPARFYGPSHEKAFPVLQQPLAIKDDSAIQNSKKAEEVFMKALMVCQAGGGEQGIEKHVVKNKKILVRDRIKHILDDDCVLFEVSTTAGLGLEYGDVPGASCVTGIGMIRGVLVMIVASDGSLKGGTSYPITVTKSLRAQEIAMENRLPCLYITDSGGAFLPLQADIFPDVKHGGRSFRNQAVMSGLGIPQVALVAGPCTAGGAYTCTMTDEAIMVNRIGHVFLGGPPLVFAATGEVVSQDDLGGAKMHTSVSGVADYFAKDENESFEQVRDIISGLNLISPKEFDPTENMPLFESTELDYFGGLNSLDLEDMKAVIARFVDDSRFSEFKSSFGKNLVTGFAKICDQLVGICANSGRLTARDGQKGAHFLQLCGARNIPVIFLQNNSGQNKSSEYHSAEEIKETAKFAHACANLNVPKVALNVGGLGGPQDLVAMCGPSFGARFYLSWPRARYSKQELNQSVEEGGFEVTKKGTRFSENSAQYAASRCTIDAVILPRETRSALAKCLQISLLLHCQEKGRTEQQNSVLRI